MWNSCKLLILIFYRIFRFKCKIMGGIIFICLVVMVWIFLLIKTVTEISSYPYRMRGRKLVWTNIVVIFPFLGLIMYYLYGRQNLSEQ